MNDGTESSWTAAAVVTGVSLALMTRATASGVGSVVLARARSVLHAGSPEYTALLLRASALKDGVSIRDICRERAGWFRSRAALYRRSQAGAALVARSLMVDGIPVPDAIARKDGRPPRVAA